tara:strand:+ start:20497 stop:22170 length:1674 start_codon:yes stop_codon:yes gene_type:complete
MSDLLTTLNYTRTGTASPITIEDSENTTVNVGSEIKNDTFRIKVKNAATNVLSDGTIQHNWVNSNGEVIFDVVKPKRGEIINEEIVEIYAKYTETDPTEVITNAQSLLFDGIINKAKVLYSEGSTSIEISGKNRSVVALDKLTLPQGFKAIDSAKSPTIIQTIIQNATEANETPTSKGFLSDGTVVTSNAQFLVDARLFSAGIVDSGTISSLSERKLIEEGQNFLTTVDIGDWVRNSSTNQYAYVVSVDDDTTLTLTKDIFTAELQTYQISDAFMQDTRPDGTAYPNISFNQLEKPVVEAVGKLSQVENTNSVAEQASGLIIKRGMRWFIDTQNRFHWYVPDDTPEHIMSVGQTSAISPDANNHIIHNVELNKDDDNNVNFIVFKAGEDMKGVQIKNFARAQFSGTPIAKEAKRTWAHIARNMKHDDAVEGNIVKVAFDDYAYPTSYPMTPVWDRDQASVANDAAYNANFQTEAILRGQDIARKIFQGLANPRYKGSIIVRGELFQVGDLIQFTSNPHGVKNVNMRITQLTHTISPAQGWITNIRMEEDELEISEIQ